MEVGITVGLSLGIQLTFMQRVAILPVVRVSGIVGHPFTLRAFFS